MCEPKDSAGCRGSILQIALGTPTSYSCTNSRLHPVNKIAFLCVTLHSTCLLSTQILGDGNIKLKLKIKAAKFSSSAKEKIEAAGGEIIEVPQKAKWTRALHRQKVKAAAAAAPPQPAEKKKPFQAAKKPAKKPKK